MAYRHSAPAQLGTRASKCFFVLWLNKKTRPHLPLRWSKERLANSFLFLACRSQCQWSERKAKLAQLQPTALVLHWHTCTHRDPSKGKQAQAVEALGCVWPLRIKSNCANAAWQFLHLQARRDGGLFQLYHSTPLPLQGSLPTALVSAGWMGPCEVDREGWGSPLRSKSMK